MYPPPNYDGGVQLHLLNIGKNLFLNLRNFELFFQVLPKICQNQQKPLTQPHVFKIFGMSKYSFQSTKLSKPCFQKKYLMEGGNVKKTIFLRKKFHFENQNSKCDLIFCKLNYRGISLKRAKFASHIRSRTLTFFFVGDRRKNSI